MKNVQMVYGTGVIRAKHKDMHGMPAIVLMQECGIII